LTTLVIGATRETDRKVGEGGGQDKSGLFIGSSSARIGLPPTNKYLMSVCVSLITTRNREWIAPFPERGLAFRLGCV